MVSGSDKPNDPMTQCRKEERLNDANERFKPILGMVLATSKDHAASHHDQDGGNYDFVGTIQSVTCHHGPKR